MQHGHSYLNYTVMQSRLPSTSAPYMPSKKATQTMINRIRNRELQKIPTKLDDLQIPEENQTMERKQFLIGHYSFKDDIVIVFSTEQNLRSLLVFFGYVRYFKSSVILSDVHNTWQSWSKRRYYAIFLLVMGS